MRATAAAAVASVLVRLFPASTLRSYILKQAALCGAAVLFVSLLSLTYGLDLSVGFF